MKMNEKISAGIMKNSGQDYLIRGMGRIKSIADIEESVVIAIKNYGPEFYQLRTINDQIYNAIKNVPGLVDVGVEQQVDISQICINPIRHELAKYGVTIVDLAHIAELALKVLPYRQCLMGKKNLISS